MLLIGTVGMVLWSHLADRLSRRHAAARLSLPAACALAGFLLLTPAFGALHPGTAFELRNDHDPKPLYYQFAAEMPGQFTWDYLEQGPEVWRVRIGRTEGAAVETA